MGLVGCFSCNNNGINDSKFYSMNKADSYYIKNLNKILSEGSWDENPRPKYIDGAPAYSKFITGVFEEYDISKNEFPIPTLRNTAIKTGIKEILWIYQKQTSSLSVAKDMGINWWDSWDIGDGTIGQRYGATIAKYNLVQTLLDGLINEPFSRRHIINLYQYSDLSETKGLFPCAYEVTFSVRKGNSKLVLDMTLIQRSNDYIVAGYINKIQYVALMMMVANHCNFDVGVFRHLVQNLHIYDRHFDAVNELLDRTPLDSQPLLTLDTKKTFNDYNIDDFTIHNVNGIQKLKSNLELAI
jgi:thymidylate synthase